jgi:hypothetical protein
MRTYIVLMAATFLIMIEPCRAVDLPPDEIVREDCAKADVIVEGSIESFETPHNWPATRTEFRINRVYRGPVSAGDMITYYSSREAGSRNVGDNLLLFLVRWTDAAGLRKWGTATEFSEYLNSPPLELKVRKCARSKVGVARMSAQRDIRVSRMSP